MLKNKVIIITVHQEPMLSNFNNLRSFLFYKIPLSLTDGVSFHLIEHAGFSPSEGNFFYGNCTFA